MFDKSTGVLLDSEAAPQGWRAGELVCRHVDCEVDNIVIDKANTTPANILARNLVELRDDIVKLVGACQDLVA